MRQRLCILSAAVVSLVASNLAVAAQDRPSIEGQSASPPQKIDILAPVIDGGLDPLSQQQCDDERDGAIIAGEIIVCGARQGTTDGVWNRQAWEQAYARESAYINDPQPPDVAGPGIFRGPPTISGLCILNDCPPPPAIFIDLAALPPPPKGSDAERIAQGLTALGNSGERGEDYSEEELGLPPVPDFSD